MVTGTGTARRCEESPSGTSSAGGREEAAASGGERRTEGTGASAGRWEMGRAATGGAPRSGSAGEVGSGSTSGAAATITGRGAGWMGKTQGAGARVSIPIRLILAREREVGKPGTEEEEAAGGGGGARPREAGTERGSKSKRSNAVRPVRGRRLFWLLALVPFSLCVRWTVRKKPLNILVIITLTNIRCNSLHSYFSIKQYFPFFNFQHRPEHLFINHIWFETAGCSIHS